MTASPRVVIGADTHLDAIHLAVITDAGKSLADSEFPTTPAGYDDALAWHAASANIAIAGVEVTSSYGAGLTRVLQAAGWRWSKSAAPIAQRGVAKASPILWTPTLLPGPRWRGPTNQIHALLLTGPAELRERYRRHSTPP